MTKKRLKPYVLPTIYIMLVMILSLVTFSLSNSLMVAEEKIENNYTYVSYEVLFDESVPVINTINSKLIKPFTDNTVEVLTNYYDINEDEQNQQESIIYYNNTYIQSDGITYMAKNIFDCLAVLDGEVIDIKDNDIVGKTVTIRHNEELISVYQNLSEVTVSINDKVNQGDIIGTSGQKAMENKEGNFLHFELIYNNSYINPEKYYGRIVGE